MPGAASHTLYGGAKAMLIKMSQSLHSEQQGSGVFRQRSVSGFTYSEFHDVNGTRAAMSPFAEISLAHFGARRQGRLSRADEERAGLHSRRPIQGDQHVVRLLPMGLAHRIGRARSKILEKEGGR
jgi:short-subunit dehydrogenase